MSEWIKIADYKELPEGVWLVETEKERSPYQVAYVTTKTADGHKMIIIGNHFSFDAKPPKRYMAIPE